MSNTDTVTETVIEPVDDKDTTAATDAAKTTDATKTDTTATGKANGATQTKTQDTVAGGDAGEGEDDDRDAAAKSPFGENWRSDLAGDKKERLKWLDRLQSPRGLVTKIENLEKKLNEKVPNRAPPEDPEELKAWRKDWDIPETPEAYLEGLKLPDGKELGDMDKPIAESYAKFAHENNIPKDILGKNVHWYQGWLEQLRNQQADEDAAFNETTVTGLKEELGAEYKRSVNSINSLFAEAPDGMMDRLRLGRMADGRRIGDDPDFLRWAIGLARTVNPAASILPSGSEGGIKGVETRIAEIEKVMKTDRRAYDKNAGMQKELLDLYEAREKLKNRAA